MTESCPSFRAPTDTVRSQLPVVVFSGCRSKPLRFVTEVVQGIRIAKLYAWEEAIFRIPAPQRTENGELSPRPSPSPLD